MPITTYTVDAQNLSTVVKALLPVIDAKSPKAWARCVKLCADGNGRPLLSTLSNLRWISYVGASVPLAGVCDGDKPAIIPARDLLDALKGRKGDVRITASGTQNTIRIADYSRICDAVEGPEEHEETTPNASGAALASFRVPAVRMADALRRAIPFVSKGDTRYALNGVCLAIGTSSVDTVASDTHRLIRVNLGGCVRDVGAEDEETSNSGVNAIIPLDAVKSLYALLESQAADAVAEDAQMEDALVVADARYVHVITDGRAWFTARRLEGSFPRWRDVIPGTRRPVTGSVMLDRKATMAVLKCLPVEPERRKVALFPAEGGNALRLEGDKSSATLRAFTARMPAGLLFNSGYLMDTLGAAKEDYVTISARDGNNPARLDDGNVTAVLMPLYNGGGSPEEVSTEERGAESLEAALALDDPDPAAFFGQSAAPAKPKKAARRISLDAVIAWIVDAPEHERERAYTLLGRYMRTREAREAAAPAAA